MKVKLALVSAQDYERGKAIASECGLQGKKMVVFTDPELLSRWVTSLGERQELQQTLRYRLDPV